MAVSKYHEALPPCRLTERVGMHRMLASRYSEPAEGAMAEVSEDELMHLALILLAGLTNSAVQGEDRGVPGIGPYELVRGIPHARIVNAAFLHPNPAGSRFNDATRGAWYAADELETSVVEVAFHKARLLGDIVVPKLPGKRPDRETSIWDDWLADFHCELHILEPVDVFSDCLVPEPVPDCYATSQRLARQLLRLPASGLVYPSVRRPGHECLVCFRPALVYRPRREQRLEMTLLASRDGYQHQTRPMALPA